ncbi:MAG: threonine aldolase family protein [Gaiella sp.]
MGDRPALRHRDPSDGRDAGGDRRGRVGDEQRREDPTVVALEERVAALLGHEAGLFVPTATMANQIALKLHSRPGDVLVAHEHAHVLVYEYGGAAVHAGLVTLGLSSDDGRFTPAQLAAAAAPSAKVADQRVSVISIEDTSNAAGGRCWPLDELAAVTHTARELGLAVHLDGARLLNAAVAQDVSPAEIAGQADTATLCLSKGLGCPLGAVLVGSRELLDRAWREKHLFGGAMRQAGIVAAAGVYALEHHVARLAEDHGRARVLAEAWHAGGVPALIDRVETNFVQVDVAPLGLTAEEALERLHGAGVALSRTIHPTVLRAVTHLDVTDEDVEVAVSAVPRALRGSRVGA